MNNQSNQTPEEEIPIVESPEVPLFHKVTDTACMPKYYEEGETYQCFEGLTEYS